MDSLPLSHPLSIVEAMGEHTEKGNSMRKVGLQNAEGIYATKGSTELKSGNPALEEGEATVRLWP